MSNFKIAVISIFSVCFVIGIILFATYKSSGSQSAAHLTVWGTLPSADFDAAYKNSSIASNKQTTVVYVQKSQATFDNDLLVALADGTGPDVVILRDDDVYQNMPRLLLIPYTSYPERTFKDTFVQGGEMFLQTNGIVSVPFMIDPMVMYWNRDLFSNNNVSQPPQYWDQMYNLVTAMTKKDSSADISQSALSLGEWDNITNAKELLSLILLQAGTPIVSYTSQGYSSVMSSQFGNAVVPGQVALDFYTQFSNPTSASYSWNKALPSSLNFFLSGNLAIYFGFSSELFNIQQKNPNLNFDVAPIPQVRGGTVDLDFAHMYSLAILKQSASPSAAFSLISALTESSAQTALEKVTNLPSVRRDLLSVTPTDPFRTVFYKDALISRSWNDPDPVSTSNIFRDMVDSVTSGQSQSLEAVSGADQNIDLLFK